MKSFFFFLSVRALDITIHPGRFYHDERAKIILLFSPLVLFSLSFLVS